MLYASARACLAIVLDRPDLSTVLFDNLTPEHFEGSAAIVFTAMKELQEDGMDFGWADVRDKLAGRITVDYWRELMDSTRGLTPSNTEAYLRERVQAIKNEHGKRKLMLALERTAVKSVLDDDDIDEIEKTTQRMRMVDRPKEEPSFRAALSAYKEHISQAASEITLGLRTLDRLIDGFNPGELVTIAARSGVGKTFVALNIIDHLVQKVPFKMALFSLEMPKSAIAERLAEIHFGISRHDAKRQALDGELDEAEFERAYSQLAVYEKTYSASEIRKVIEREAFKIVFIDFLHLVRSELERATPYQQISAIMASLKQTAKDTGCVAFLLHQLSRQAGSGYTRVETAHLRDSGQMEELSDFIIGFWAPGLAPDAPPEMESTLSCTLAKNKRGPHFHYDLRFDKSCGRIYEEDEDGRGAHAGRRRPHDWSEPEGGDD